MELALSPTWATAPPLQEQFENLALSIGRGLPILTDSSTQDSPNDPSAMKRTSSVTTYHPLYRSLVSETTRSELLQAAEELDQEPHNVLKLPIQSLTSEEIFILKEQGCTCLDWDMVKVSEGFTPLRVRNVKFGGKIVMGRYTGTREVVKGIPIESGIYSSHLINCQIGDDVLIENVRFGANLIVEAGAILFNIGHITCKPGATFGCGQELPLANEAGGREVLSWPEMTIPTASLLVRERGCKTGQDLVTTAIQEYVKGITSPMGWVREGASVLNTINIDDTYIGSYAVVNNAQELSNVCLLSSRAEPTTVNGGSIVTDTIAQWGVHVSGASIVRKSVLLEYSSVEEHGKVAESVIGPNTGIGKGEVTASLVGPFVGFHHQSLLISAYWPEGKGNIAYGAKVGSNHTGRAPDQEIWPGEGTFFGLGSAIRFPSDFSCAPYSVFAAGVSTLPQALHMPFSLISIAETGIMADHGEAVPRAFNELLPGWGLYKNAYAIGRAEIKYGKRDKSRRHGTAHFVLRPALMRLVKNALSILQNPPKVQNIYLPGDMEGIGKNFMRESTRLAGITAYENVLKRYCLRILLAKAEGNPILQDSIEVAEDLAEMLMPGTTFAERMDELVKVETENAQLVRQNKVEDDVRGARIIPGYADAHSPADEDSVVRDALKRARTTKERVDKVLNK